MKITYKSKNGRFLIEAQADTVKDAFMQIGGAAAVFEAESACGKCNSTDIRPNFKITGAGSYKYYELVCMACHAQFSFGQAKTGEVLFPKRKDDHGPLAHRGWKIFSHSDGDDPDDYSSQAGPREAPRQDKPAPTSGSDRPAETTEMYRNLAGRLGSPVVPHNFVSALTMMRDAMKREMGDRPGLETYQKIYQSHETRHGGGAWSHDDIRLVMVDLWNAIPKRQVA